MAGRLHDDELSIGLPLVQALIQRDHPGLASLPLRRLEFSGSSNALFKLGNDLLVRLPRQPGGSAVIDKEARWLPLVGPQLPVPVPEVVAVGEPGLGYPERWSLVRWLDGSVPEVPRVAQPCSTPRNELAADLARAVVAMRAIDVPPEALSDPELRWYRGDPLGTQDGPTRAGIDACRSIDGLPLDLDEVAGMWEAAMALPDVERVVSPSWFHGDLFAENLLERNGRLAAILDFGGLAVGDPTIDLIVAWELLDAAERDVFRKVSGADESSWLRARAWSLSLAIRSFPYYWHTMPDRCATKLAVVDSILADARR